MTVYTSSQGLNAIGTLPSAYGHNSVNERMLHDGRYETHLDHTVDGNAAQTDNIFVLTGIVEVSELLFHIDTATDITTFSNVKFQLWDSAAATDLCDDVDASGAAAGSMVYKRGLIGQAAILLDTTAGVVGEAAANKISFEPFFVGKDAAAATWIRLAFTGDANTDVDIHMVARWRPFSHDGALTAV